MRYISSITFNTIRSGFLNNRSLITVSGQQHITVCPRSKRGFPAKEHGKNTWVKNSEPNRSICLITCKTFCKRALIAGFLDATHTVDEALQSEVMWWYTQLQDIKALNYSGSCTTAAALRDRYPKFFYSLQAATRELLFRLMEVILFYGAC